MVLKKKIKKIKSLELKNFKCFTDSKKINTDSDIVLLIGPNGYGKTSFLQALTLALTGHYDIPENFASDSFLKTIRPVQLDENSKEETYIKIETEITGDSQDSPLFEWNLATNYNDYGEINPLSDDTGILEYFIEKNTDLNELHARICAFFQDNIFLQFDETVKGKTLLDAVKPEPEGIKKIKEQLVNLKENLGDKIQSFQPPSMEDNQAIKDELSKKSAEFIKRYTIFHKYNQVKYPPPPETFNTGSDALNFFNTVLINLKESPYENFNDASSRYSYIQTQELKEWLKRAESRAVNKTKEGEDLEKKLNFYRQEKEAIEEEYPDLHKEVSLFDPSNSNECDALTIFQTLVNNADKWSSIHLPASSENQLALVLKQFARIDKGLAIRSRDQLANWLEPRIEKYERLEYLKKEIFRINEELDKYKTSEEFDDAKILNLSFQKNLKELIETCIKEFKYEEKVKKQVQRDNAAEYLKLYENAVKEVLSFLEIETSIMSRSEINEKIKSDLEKTIETIAKRFSFTKGIMPVKLENNFDENLGRRFITLKSSDKRGLSHFSTGQKAQLAISTLIAQNSLLSRFLNHRIIMLDDMTTSYDLSNLTRESILWRQLAYNDDSENELKRQIFISTHHEDLTNKLIELLAPPHGHSLRLIKFNGENKKSDKYFDEYRVQPCSKLDDIRKDFAEDLKDFYK